MRSTMRKARFVSLSLAVLLGTAVAGQVKDADLLNPDPNDFLLYSGTYDSQRHSPLKQINTSNVGQPAGEVDLPSDRCERSRGAADCLQGRDVCRPVQPRARARRRNRTTHLGIHAAAAERRLAARHRHLRRHGLHGRAGFSARRARSPHRQSHCGKRGRRSPASASRDRCRSPRRA